MKKICVLFVISVLFSFTACKSSRIEVPEDYTQTQILQLGQKAYSDSRYKDAEYYYSVALARFGHDTNNYIETKYELSHLYIVMKEYRKAYNGFKEILSIYDAAPSGVLNPSFKKLCNIGLSQIPEEKLKEFDEITSE
ncbi:MAG: hypothetical protein IKX23_06860 [Treponema sp.]|nr:hypothetical protein [Treponema sp.]